MNIHNVLWCLVTMCISIKDLLGGKWKWNCNVRTLECEMWARTIRQLAAGERNYKEQKKMVAWADDHESESHVSEKVIFVYRSSCVIPFLPGNGSETVIFKEKMLQERVIATVTYILRKMRLKVASFILLLLCLWCLVFGNGSAYCYWEIFHLKLSFLYSSQILTSTILLQNFGEGKLRRNSTVALIIWKQLQWLLK